jgi:hypothetical protein
VFEWVAILQWVGWVFEWVAGGYPHLGEVTQPQVGVLQEYPLPLCKRRGHVFTRDYFLPLPHADPQGPHFLPLC